MRIKCGNCGSEYEPRWVSIQRPYRPYGPIWCTSDNNNTYTTTTTTTGFGYYQIYPYTPWEQYPYNYSGYYDYSCPVCGYYAYTYPPVKKYTPPVRPIKPKKPYDWRPYEFTEDK